ncbi:MAG: hypothetical protein GX552_17905 [Chloroflexi bacterium]|jgi:hypothetical protein|nr:hypothetical protein [Chloroflexota bacterium]
MPKVGRNDPCPCGSGRKYKNCCMRQDRLSESRELNTQDAESFLLNNLYNFAQSPRFGRDLAEAFSVYWSGIYDLQGVGQVVAQDDMQRMMEWFIHDYHTSTDDRRYVIDLFIETQTKEYPQEALQILQAWSQSTMGAFRVQDFAEGDRLPVYDLFRQEPMEIYNSALARNAQRGDLLVGRLFELGGVKRLSTMAMLLPGEYEPGLLEYGQNAYDNYRSEHYQATWDEFLREYGYIFNAYLLSSKAEALRSLIGPGTRFHDPAISRDKLREHTRRRVQERQAEQEEARRGRPAEHRTTSGIVLPGATNREQQSEQEQDKPQILIPGRDF